MAQLRAITALSEGPGLDPKHPDQAVSNSSSWQSETLLTSIVHKKKNHAGVHINNKFPFFSRQGFPV